MREIPDSLEVIVARLEAYRLERQALGAKLNRKDLPSDKRRRLQDRLEFLDFHMPDLLNRHNELMKQERKLVGVR